MNLNASKPQTGIDKHTIRCDTAGESEFNGKSDKEIWSELKDGSEVACIYIYKMYFHILFRYGSQFTKDRFLLKDTIQDLFIELLKRRSRLSDTTSIKYYLFKAVKTNLISKLKARKRIDFKEDMTDGYDFEISLSQEQLLINSQINETNRDLINRALENLTRKQREIIYYYYFQELNLSEIASLMHFTNEKSAQNLLYRALSILKGSMSSQLLIALSGMLILAGCSCLNFSLSIQTTDS